MTPQEALDVVRQKIERLTERPRGEDLRLLEALRAIVAFGETLLPPQDPEAARRP